MLEGEVLPWGPGERALASTAGTAAETSIKIDYNVLSVAAMTLALIMMVEFVRHRLDHSALRRPFFRAVLEGVYAELATLGIVEFFLFLVSQYYSNYDRARKEVFADVHFLLFYTAILNALQSVLTAVVTTRISRRLWVTTELLELNHYVEIREEFDRVQQELDRLHDPRRRWRDRAKAHREENAASSAIERVPVRRGDSAEGGDQERGPPSPALVLERAFEFNRQSVTTVWKALMDSVRYPRLQRKYHRLLTQIRFHELRVHFLQSYNLPLKLKVSDYLIRSEQRVLIKLVSVSTAAWLLLTMAVCFLYFVLGIVFYNYGSEKLVGQALVWIFFWCIAVFVIVSWLVSNKMKSVFGKIMHEKTLWDVHGNDPEEKERLSKQQLALFWGREPSLVISAIQFMQFGYAASLSTILIFWKQINDGEVGMHWYLIALGLCYALFVHVTGHAIPKYTLCTNLAQLVDKRRLRETVALFHLNEAKQKQLELLSCLAYENDVVIQDGLKRKPDDAINDDDAPQAGSLADEAQHAMSPLAERANYPPEQPVLAQDAGGLQSQMGLLSTPLPDRGGLVLVDFDEVRRRKSNRRKVVSDGVAAMANMTIAFSRSSEESCSPPSTETGELGRLMTARNTANLPTRTLPDQALQDLARARRRDRHSRQKSVSDGVSMMARLSETEGGSLCDVRHLKPFAAHRPVGGLAVEHPSSLSRLSRKVDSGDLMAELVKLDTKALRTNLPESEQRRLIDRDGARQLRKTRQKGRSSGVDAMAAMDSSMSAAAGLALGTRNNSYDGFDNDWRTSVKSLPINGLRDGSTPFDSKLIRKSVRRAGQKSMSDGVAVMAGFSKSADIFDHFIGTTMEDITVGCPRPGSSGLAVAKQSLNSASTPSLMNELETVDSEPVPELLSPDADAERIVEKTDDASATSIASIDGCSDVDDVPDAAFTSSAAYAQILEPRLSVRDKLHAYFLSKQHVDASTVFGTIFAFFLVGQRVEGFIHTQDIIPPGFVALYLSLEVTFWLLTAWFGLFLFANGLILFLFQCTRNKKEYEVVLAAVLDAVISTVCLTVLCVAESNRCCASENSQRVRDLAAEATNFGSAVEGPAPCSCPSFGSRSYGGLGSIEPYTSLVVLRFFRQRIARRLVDKFAREYDWPKFDVEDESTTHGADFADPLSVREGDQAKAHSQSSVDTVTVVAQAWETTIGARPDLVAVYGEFSGEILRAMLGVAQGRTLAPAPTEERVENLKEDPCKETPVGRNILASAKSFSLNKEYAGLSAEAQEIILAGKLGCSLIRNVQPLDRQPPALPVDESLIPELGALKNPNSEGNLLFEIDTHAHTGNYELLLTSPNARLVRCMRRCDRKFLPILDKWAAVDVVMTRFEMIYFDAVGVDDILLENGGEGTRQAIVATRGGKGLRLGDVAVGRRVVGRLSFADVACLHVERVMPNNGSTTIGDCPGVEIEQTEFWKQGSKGAQPHGHEGDQTRGNQWGTVKQDLLTIDTVHGHTLFLRFYADLEYSESQLDQLHQHDDAAAFLQKNNALQWVKTIGRFCGREQLKQQLPHFGDDTAEELRDFLVVVDRPSDFKGHRRAKSGDVVFRHLPRSSRSRKSMLRLRMSSMDLASLDASNDGVLSLDAEANTNNVPVSRRKLFRSRMSSMHAGLPPLSVPNNLARSTSFGAAAAHSARETESSVKVRRRNFLHRRMASMDGVMIASGGPTEKKATVTNSDVPAGEEDSAISRSSRENLAKKVSFSDPRAQAENPDETL